MGGGRHRTRVLGAGCHARVADSFGAVPSKVMGVWAVPPALPWGTGRGVPSASTREGPRPALHGTRFSWAATLSPMEWAGTREPSVSVPRGLPGLPRPAVPVWASMLLGTRGRSGRSVGRGSPGSQHAGRGQGSACSRTPLSGGCDPAASSAFQGKEEDVGGRVSSMSTTRECLQVSTFQNLPRQHR